MVTKLGPDVSKVDVSQTVTDSTLKQWSREAASGDRQAAENLLSAMADGFYQLAMRMLGHPQDAEDAAQDISIIVLTHLGSFRGDSAFRTWAWRIATNHLLRTRQGRRETISFETVAGMLDEGLANLSGPSEPESSILSREVRLRCTEAMLLSLDRPSRIVIILGDLFGLSGEEAADILEIKPSTYRRRLSRARNRLIAFLKIRCGLFDSSNPCRCHRQVPTAVALGRLSEDQLFFADQKVCSGTISQILERCTDEVTGLLHAIEVLRHPAYAAPGTLAIRIRSLLQSGTLELLRD